MPRRVPATIVTGDFNEDGKSDFVTTNANTDNMSVVLGNGDGTFAAAVQVVLRPGLDFPYGIDAADIDKDGHVDLVLDGFFTSNVIVMRGDGHGGFVKAATLSPGVQFPQYLRLADLDEDGNPDIVTGNANALGQFSVMLGDGSGGFGTATVTSLGDEDHFSNPGDAEAGDGNGDGQLDIAVESYASTAPRRRTCRC